MDSCLFFSRETDCKLFNFFSRQYLFIVPQRRFVATARTPGAPRASPARLQGAIGSGARAAGRTGSVSRGRRTPRDGPGRFGSVALGRDQARAGPAQWRLMAERPKEAKASGCSGACGNRRTSARARARTHIPAAG